MELLQLEAKAATMLQQFWKMKLEMPLCKWAPKISLNYDSV
jgi:hypothetical protein